MAAPRNRRHIIVPEQPVAESYAPHSRKVSIPKAPAPSSRFQHGSSLKKALDTAVAEAATRRESANLSVYGASPGLYVQFESQPGIALNLTSLEDYRKGIEVVAVSHVQTADDSASRVERATVFVPEGNVSHFVQRFTAYSNDSPKSKKGERRYEAMLDPVATLRLATLRGLWTDAADAYPTEGEVIWWEVWLRRHDGEELARFMEFAQAAGLSVGARRLEFDDRIVLLAKSSAEQLSSSVDVLNDMAEVRRAKESAASFVDLLSEEQAEWAENLLGRLAGCGKTACFG